MVSRYKVCSGSYVSLTNLSTGANDFEWLIENIHYSNAADTSFVFTENCYDKKIITLIACDTITGFCDSSVEFVEVFDSCFFHWTGDFLHCPGDTITLNTHPEAASTFWDYQPAIVYTSGCDTCGLVEFILQQNNTTVDRHVTYPGGCSEITTFHYFCSLSHITETEIDFGFYPNPADDKIFLSHPAANAAEIIIHDLQGKVIYREKIETDKNFIDVRSLQNGFYLMSIITSVKKITGKILIHRYY